MMKTMHWLFRMGTVALATTLLASSLRADNTEAVNEVIKLKNAGVAEATIVAYIQNKNLSYDLTADNILALRDKGVPPAVLNAMLASGGKITPANVPSAPAGPTPAPAAPVTPPVSAIPAQGAPPIVPVQPLRPNRVELVAAQPSGDPDVAYFYQELSPYGRWIRTEDGQWCWQPSIVAGARDWRPYWDKGHWVWTDHGWYWASDYSWGWATFHYGRWHLHPHHGWVWYPDRVWGPAWVTWRAGGDYCGWAPLPPGAVYDVSAGQFIFRGRRVGVDFDFGLNFAHFSFCFTRELGDPMRRRFRNEMERRDIFRRTTVMNHYTVNRVSVRGESRPQVFNHGIEPSRVHGGRGRPMEAVRIEEMNTPVPGRAHERLDPKNRTLEVYRPRFEGHH